MTELQIVKDWIKKYPKFDELKNFKVDYTDNVPNNGGIFPSGLVEVSRKEDILGNVTVENQYNFGLFYVFPKSKEDEAQSQFNADWVMDFQKWVQEQSAYGLAPKFGENDSVRAENGVLFDTDGEGTATYTVQLAFNFIKKFNEVI